MNGHIDRKGGRYYVALELDRERDPDTGRIERRRVGAGSYKTKREAEEALREALVGARRGWRGPSRLTLASYLRDEWLPGIDLQLAPTTAALYRTLCEAYMIPRIGGLRLDAITSGDLTKLYADLLVSGSRHGGPLAPKSVRHVHTTIRKALGDAVESRHISLQPRDVREGAEGFGNEGSEGLEGRGGCAVPRPRLGGPPRRPVDARCDERHASR
jgi:hypothetical protein